MSQAQLGICPDWGIEIVPGPPPGLSLGCGQYDPTCGPLYYSVYLVPNGAQSSPDFVFSTFQIEGRLRRKGFSVGLLPANSQFNNQRSIDCSPPDLLQNGGAFSAVADLFSYVVTPDNGGTDTWQVNGQRLLFVLAVDPFADEEITLDFLSASYSRPDGEKGSFACELPIIANNLFQALLPAPVCTTDVTISLGPVENLPSPLFPQRRRIPVFVYALTPGPYDLDELDLYTELSTTIGNKLGAYVLTDGIVPKTAISTSNLSSAIAALSLNSGPLTGVTAATTPNAGNILFYIELNGPTLATLCANTIVTLKKGKLALAGMSCCSLPFTSGPLRSRTVEWLPAPPNICPTECSSFKVEVKRTTYTRNMCDEVFFIVELSSTVFPRTVTEVRFSVDISYNATGAIQWDKNISDLPGCPDPNLCVYTELIAPGTLRLHYQLGGTQIQLLSAGSPYGIGRFGFTGNSACIQSVDFRDAAIKTTSGTNECIPMIRSEILRDNPSTHLCFNNIAVTYATENGKVSALPMTLKVSNCLSTQIEGGSYSKCHTGPNPGTPRQVWLENNDHWLNGVTTLDLAMISKHILNLQPLPSPYTLIAADANYTGSITTLDIVALRRLILGIADSIPSWIPPGTSDPVYSKSFRFIDKSYTFPNPANPFEQQFPERVSFTYDVKAAFVAIKTGDVNYSHQRPSGSSFLAYSLPAASVAQVFEIPVFASENTSYTGWQLALRYDTSALHCKGIRWLAEKGEREDRGWHEPRKGQLRVLCYDAEGRPRSYGKGTPLFYVQMEARRAIPASKGGGGGAALVSMDPAIPAEAYLSDESTLQLLLKASDLPVTERFEAKKQEAPAPALQMEAYPNPAGSVFRVELWVPEDTEAEMVVTDALGRSVLQKQLSLTKGLHTQLSSQWNAAFASGAYFISLHTAQGVVSKRLVIK